MRLRRIVSGLCAVVMIATTAASMVACGKKESSIYINMGQWLEMVNDSFGMSSYTTGEPYFTNVVNGDPYFGAVQIAAEWNVIDTEDTEFDPSKTLCWGDALLTLVNVGEFVDESASDEEKINYAIENFDSSIRDYWMDREIEVEKAIPLLTTAQDLWANKKYDHKIEKVTYAEGVIDLSTPDTPINTYDINGNIVTIPTQQESAVSDTGEIKYTQIGTEDLGIKSGDVYILPPTEDNREVTAYKANNIVEENGNVVIENSDEDLDLYDVAQDIQVQGTFEPDMSQVTIYDADGNMISDGNNVITTSSATEESTIELLGTNNFISNGMIENCSSKVSHTFKVGDEKNPFEVNISSDLNGKFNFNAEVSTPNLLDSDDHKLEGKAGFSIKNLEVSQKIDYSWFTLHSAEAKVDYEVSETFGISYSTKPVDKVKAPKYTNGNGAFMTNLKRAVWKDKSSKGAKNIKIASVTLSDAVIARITLDINLVVKVDGSLEITVTERGCKGIEYKNKNLRLINTSDKDTDVELKGSVELTVGVGPSLYVTFIKKPIINFSANIGVGAEASVTVHVADSQGHLIEESKDGDTPPETYEVLQGMDLEADAEAIKALAESEGCTYTVESSAPVKLHADCCIDVSVYFILKVGIGDSYAKDIVKDIVDLSWDIFNSKNAKFANIHIENFDFATAFSNIKFGSAANTNQCTMKYVPFDKAEDVSSQSDSDNSGSNDSSLKQNEDSDIANGDRIVISQLKGAIYPNGNTVLVLEQVPEGYSLSDIRFESDDTSVATVDSSGVVTGNKPGTAMIKVYTSDEKHMIVCSIVVLEAESKAA